MNIKTITAKNAGRSAQAYTLAEVLICVAVVGVVMGSLLPGIVMGFASIKTTREDERATQIVTQKLEGFRLITWDNQNVCPTNFVEFYDPTAPAGSQGVAYYGTITIETNGTTGGLPAVIPSSCTYQGEIRLVTIGVTWTNYINKNVPIPHTRQMQTLSAFYGLQNYLFGQF